MPPTRPTSVSTCGMARMPVPSAVHAQLKVTARRLEVPDTRNALDDRSTAFPAARPSPSPGSPRAGLPLSVRASLGRSFTSIGASLGVVAPFSASPRLPRGRTSCPRSWLIKG